MVKMDYDRGNRCDRMSNCDTTCSRTSGVDRRNCDCGVLCVCGDCTCVCSSGDGWCCTFRSGDSMHDRKSRRRACSSWSRTDGSCNRSDRNSSRCKAVHYRISGDSQRNCIADDYFKAKKQGGTLESDIEAKDKEMYDLKHELISVQIKLENAEKAMDKLKEENKELQMKIVQLETEIKNNK